MDENIGYGVIQVMECVLDSLVKRYDKTPQTQSSRTKFHALRPPNISLRDYIERIRKYGRLSIECFVLSLIYIDRLIKNINIVVNSYSVHRIVITSVMLAAKFFDDRYCSNVFYAQIGGVTVDEINSLETEFLFYINFHLFVTPQEYQMYYNMLYLHATERQCVNCRNIVFPKMIQQYNEKGEEEFIYDMPVHRNQNKPMTMTIHNTMKQQQQQPLPVAKPVAMPVQTINRNPMMNGMKQHPSLAHHPPNSVPMMKHMPRAPSSNQSMPVNSYNYMIPQVPPHVLQSMPVPPPTMSQPIQVAPPPLYNSMPLSMSGPQQTYVPPKQYEDNYYFSSSLFNY